MQRDIIEELLNNLQLKGRFKNDLRGLPFDIGRRQSRYLMVFQVVLLVLNYRVCS